MQNFRSQKLQKKWKEALKNRLRHSVLIKIFVNKSGKLVTRPKNECILRSSRLKTAVSAFYDCSVGFYKNFKIKLSVIFVFHTVAIKIIDAKEFFTMSKNLPFSVHQHFVYLIQADSSGNYYGSLEVATIENGKTQYTYGIVHGDSFECYRNKVIVATVVCDTRNYMLPEFKVKIPAEIRQWMRDEEKCLQIYKLMRNEI